jgi:hypothetical protein
MPLARRSVASQFREVAKRRVTMTYARDNLQHKLPGRFARPDLPTPEHRSAWLGPPATNLFERSTG